MAERIYTKLQKIADNVQKVYASGYEKGKADTETKRVSFENGETIEVVNNTIYTATTPINNLTVIYPEDEFICSLNFTVANTGDVTITLPESEYIGGIPSLENGETWELNIQDGVIVGGRVE